MDTRVFLARCDTYEQADSAVERVLDAFGGAAAILAGRKRVLVKPNLIMPKKPDAAATTHPAVVAAVCAAFVKAGADVAIIDSTGGPHSKAVLKMLYSRCGMEDAARQSGARLSYDTRSRTVETPDGRVIQKITLLAPVLGAELVVSVGKAKTHGMMSMTGCSKNLFGCVPGLGKPNLHRKYPNRKDFAGMLVDVCERINPGFSVLDGVWGMEGAGPTGGDPKHLRVIAGGFNPYAIDLAQCHLMGLRRDSVYSLAEAASRGLAPEAPEQLTWLGDDPEPLRTQFLPAIKHKKDAVPEILPNCAGCGDCARICPQKCIAIQDKKAVVDGDSCIRCYCCHEFCPAKAIMLG
ncbi:MAG: DUF362 domain-containing protein [Oscillospiraceae bacterium]|jgi:uncharacterized protein (DUF362 family)/Pyruvate/2-oxoacid:ferredoxin oxidoreductase delta subunit|nr:DUF362 domain-containing protein [Oscillospiraceae bacterium]